MPIIRRPGLRRPATGGRGIASLARLACGALAMAALALVAAPGAQAQEIEPNEFVPAPAGTNLALGYYVYGHETEFNTFGQTFKKNTGLEVNLGIARYVHYVEVGGHPAGFQLIQIFGSESGGQVAGQSLGSAFGVQNTALSAFIWPYANQAKKTYVVLTGFLYPPDGTYDKHATLNIGDNRWRGDVQIGLDQGIGAHFSYDLSFDTQFYGDNNNAFPGNYRLSQDPTYRAQVWANWNWNKAFQTSIGYEGFFGGREETNGFFNGNKTQEQRIRAAASLFLSPTLQTLLEINHDVSVSGGFKQAFGATLRVLYIF